MARPRNEWWKEFFVPSKSTAGWGGKTGAQWMGFDRDPDAKHEDEKLHELAVEYGMRHDLRAYDELRDYVREKYGVYLDDIDWEAFAEWYEAYFG